MSVTIEVGYGIATTESSFDTGRTAALTARNGISRHPLSVVIVFSSVRYEQEEVLRGIRSVTKETPLIGVTTEAEICNELQRDSVVVSILASPFLTVRHAAGPGVSADWRTAVSTALAGEDLAPFFSEDADSWRELTLQGKSLFGVMFSPGSGHDAVSSDSRVLSEINRRAKGRIPFFGGSAAEKWQRGRNFVLCDGRALGDAFLIALFETRLRFGIGIADPSDQFSIHRISSVTPSGERHLSPPVSAGSKVALLSSGPDGTGMTGTEALRKAIIRGGITNPAFSMIVFSAFRSRIVGDLCDELQRIRPLLGDHPLITGFLSPSEQGRGDRDESRSGYGSVRTLVIDSELSYAAQVAQENERMRAEMKRKAEESQEINEIRGRMLLNLHLQTDRTLPEVASLALDHAEALTGSTAGILAMVDDGGESLTLLAPSAHDHGQQAAGTAATRELRNEITGVLDDIIQRKQPFIVNDYMELLGIRTRAHQEYHGITRYICVPVIDGGRTVLIAAMANKPETYNDQDIQQLRFYLDGLWQIIQRHRAETALRVEREKLALTVHERTADLTAANAALLRATEAKNQFLATMSHELRTPLNAILGFSEGLQEQLLGPLNQGQEQAVAIIEESGRHLLNLINDILDLSKIEAGKLELTIAEFSPEDICHSSLCIIKEQAQKKRIHLSLSLDQPPAVMTTDPRRLKQIIINLLSNAVKFTPQGGKVSLTVTGDMEQHRVRFMIEDSGIGIAVENLKKLFKPFVQVDNRLAREFEGTGLGLALVSRLTERLGGLVQVESEPGVGSRFSVTLPLAIASDGDTVPLPPAPAAPAGPSAELTANAPLILLADDNQTFRDLAEEYLRHRGCRIITAATGDDAVQAVRQQVPDLVFMDIQMPVMDGMTAARMIRQLPQPYCLVPIIALTALAMPGDRDLCLASGMDEYLTKPVSLKELHAVAQRSLALSKTVRQGPQ